MLFVHLGLLLWMKARARIELREEAVEQDARDVIEIMKYRQVLKYRQFVDLSYTSISALTLLVG